MDHGLHVFSLLHQVAAVTEVNQVGLVHDVPPLDQVDAESLDQVHLVHDVWTPLDRVTSDCVDQVGRVKYVRHALSSLDQEAAYWLDDVSLAVEMSCCCYVLQ